MNLEDYDFDRLLGLGYTEKATGDLKNACWKGYTAIGTKKKGGRTVPNCVPIKKSDHSESDDFRQIAMGGDLTVDVECEANLPQSTPAELREAKMRKRLAAAQNRAQRQEAREQAKRAKEAKRASRDAKRMQQGFAEEMKRKPLIAGPSAGSPSFAESEDETFDFTRCVRPNGTAYGTAGKCRSGSEEAKLERDPSKDVKRGGKLIGTSPRNMSIDTINEYKARLKDARSPQEAKLLKDTIRSMEAKLKPKTRAKKKVASPSAIAREESKLATLEKRLAVANEKMDSARGRASGARLGSRTKLMTASQSRANATANKAISKAHELEQQVREQKAKINEMKGIKPKKPKAAPRTANDDRRDKLRKTIDSINERAKRLKESKGSDSPEFKRFVRKYGGTLTKLLDEQHKLVGQI